MSLCSVCNGSGIVLVGDEPIHGGNIYQHVQACLACAMGDYWRAELALVRNPPPCEVCGSPAAFNLLGAPRCPSCAYTP